MFRDYSILIDDNFILLLQITDKKIPVTLTNGSYQEFEIETFDP